MDLFKTREFGGKEFENDEQSGLKMCDGFRLKKQEGRKNEGMVPSVKHSRRSRCN